MKRIYFIIAFVFTQFAIGQNYYYKIEYDIVETGSYPFEFPEINQVLSLLSDQSASNGYSDALLRFTIPGGNQLGNYKEDFILSTNEEANWKLMGHSAENVPSEYTTCMDIPESGTVTQTCELSALFEWTVDCSSPSGGYYEKRFNYFNVIQIIDFATLNNYSTETSNLKKCESHEFMAYPACFDNSKMGYSVDIIYNNGNVYNLLPYARHPKKFTLNYSDIPNLPDEEAFTIRLNYVENPTLNYEYSTATYDFIACSPELSSISENNYTTCSDSTDGTVTFTFAEDLEEGYDMRFYIYEETEANRAFFEGNPNNLEEDGDNPGFPDVARDTIIGDFNASNQATITNLASNIDPDIPGNSQDYFVVYQSIQYDGNNVIVKSGEISETFTVESPSPVIFSTDVTQPICGDDTGTITVTASGGDDFQSGEYEYSIDNGVTWQNSSVFTGLPQGSSHTINVRINLEDGIQCVSLDMETVEIETVSNPLNITSVNITQQPTYEGATNGEVQVTVSGVGPFTYQLLDTNGNSVVPEFTDTSNYVTISEIPEGNHTLRVTNNGGACSIEQGGVSFSAPTKISIASSSDTQISCYDVNDGSITVTPQDGYSETTNGPNYGYRWMKDGNPFLEEGMGDSHTIEGLSPGEYTVTITDDNNDFTNPAATVSQTFVIDEVTQVIITDVTINDITCNGARDGEINVTVSGGTGGYKYKLDGMNEFEEVGPSPFTIPIEVYTDNTTLIVSDTNGCEVTYEIPITVDEPFALEVYENPDAHIDNTIYGGNSGALEIQAEGGTLANGSDYTYSWEKDGAAYPGNTNTLSNLPAGSYQVTVTDENGCTGSLSAPIIITEPDELLITNIQPIHIKCNGFSTGSITVTAEGGIRPYHYEWEQDGNDQFTSVDSPVLDNIPAGNYRVTVTDESGSTASFTTEFIEITQPEAISLEAIVEDNLCYSDNQGSIDIAVSGGVSPYRYSWDNGAETEDIMNLTSGDYEVTITDSNDCEYTETITVGQPDGALVIEDSLVSNSTAYERNDGAIEITVTGGTAPYSYEWFSDNGFTSTEEDIANLAPGNYTLVVEDANAVEGGSNNCSIIKEFTITEPEQLLVDLEETFSLLCQGDNDGELFANVSGGVEAYQYEWYDVSDGTLIDQTTATLVDIKAGSYQVIITDANEATVTSEIHEMTEPDLLSVSLESKQDVLCYGDTTGSFDIGIFGGTAPYDIYWSNNATTEDVEQLGAGNYTVTVTDANGCWVEQEYLIENLYEPLEFANELVTHVSEYRGTDGAISVDIIGGLEPYDIIWTRTEDNSYVGNTSTISNLIHGNYHIEVTDANGCMITKTYEVTQPDIVEPTIIPPTCTDGCDGSISLLVNDGVGNYTYQWDSGATTSEISGLCAGSYKVVIEGYYDEIIERTYEVINPEPLIIDLGEDLTTLCVDQERILDATIDDAGATYQWGSDNGFSSTSSMITVNEVGIYTVTVTDSKGCIGIDSVEIKESDSVINAEFFVSSQVFVGERFTAIDVTNPLPDSIEWIVPEEAILVDQDQDQMELYFEAPGEYEVTMLTHVGECEAYQTKKILVLENDASIDGPNTETEREESYEEFLIYPNPSNGVFDVSIELKERGDISLKVFNLTSNTMMAHKTASGQTSYTVNFDISAVAPGMYAVVLETDHGNSVRKLIKG
ncbi:T9SS type A sorting domain-containing protein [Galbibacter sp. EGI 63066]|uniref:T9SS type A sorting domain-containing protein n=1 Tax=Galbibacter sp. EGI 63066 TaxID=2993559 RepID=UPI0022489044|nr:T9SS type A sorting domain-containing protein [Galbibacter sp. EGI 63066]MCX2680546.1 T9SS type A sorting domain-containing protein [Galbibacter sp. EGI 63066]